MKTFKSKRQLTLLTLVVALGVAVYLNWQYAKNGDGLNLPTEAPVDASTTQAEEFTANTDAQEVDKNYGDAQLVSAKADSGEEYFEQARLTRTKTRDEALDTLQKTLKSAKISDEEKAAATEKLTDAVSNMTAESDIENLVKAKGFVDCVTFINDGKANVAVMTKSDQLSASEVAQIRDIVLSKSGVEAQNITIVEVK